MRLSGIDLNLLVVLDALLEHASVTAAARALGLSQSATSHALARLRALLDDPILVRAGGGLVPTPRALALAGPVRAVLDEVRRSLAPVPPFDPARDRALLAIAMDDATQTGMLPALVGRMKSVAPGLDLRAIPVAPDRVFAELERGAVSVAVTTVAELPTGFRHANIARFRYVSIARRGHPVVRSKLTLRRFASVEHVVLSTSGSIDSALDERLAQAGVARRVALTTSSPVAVPAIVRATDLVATLPDLSLPRLDEDPSIVRHPPPVPLDPVDVGLVWHERSHRDPASRFLRDTVQSLFGHLSSRAPRTGAS